MCPHTTLDGLARRASTVCADGVERDCTDTSVPCNSIGSASVMWERLTFITALPTRIGTHEILDHATQTYQNVSGFHQGPCLATTGGNRQGPAPVFAPKGGSPHWRETRANRQPFHSLEGG